MASRRTVLVGLGGLVAGGGALIGTGAFDTVQANRTVNVQTTGDASALLGLSAFNRDDNSSNTTTDSNAYVTTNDNNNIVINLDGLEDTGASGINRRAKTVLRNLVTVSNQGTQNVESITLEFTPESGDIDFGETFRFPVDDLDSSGTGPTVGNGDDILTGGNGIPDTLNSGNSVNFGIEIDLLDGGTDDGDLPNDASYTLTIEANSDDSTGST